MAKFRFIGDPRGGDNPAACELFGLVFPLQAEPVEVTDPRAVERLSRNSHFERVAEPIAAMLPPEPKAAKKRRRS